MSSAAPRADVVMLDRRRFLEDARTILAGVGVLVVSVDRLGRDAEEGTGVEPVTLGRELLAALPRLVASGDVALGELVDAVRREVVEVAPGATTDELLGTTLAGLGEVEDLDQLVHTCQQEILLAQLALYAEDWQARLRRVEAEEAGRAVAVPRGLRRRWGERDDSAGEPGAGEERGVAVDRGRLIERLLSLQAPLGALVAELDQAERTAGGFGDVEPITLGRWLLGAVVHLVEDGAVSLEQLAGAVGRRRSGVAPAEAERAIEARLRAVETADELALLMREVEVAIVMAQMAFDEVKDSRPRIRTRQGREAATEDLYRTLAEEAARRREDDDAS